MAIDMTPWPGTDVEKYRAAGYWRGETFAGFLASRARAHGNRVALVDDRTRLTYAELDERTDHVAHGLRGLGLGSDDRVLLQLPNRAEFLLLWFALMKIGAVPVHTQPGHRRSEMVHLAQHSDAAAYVIPDLHAGFDHRELAAEVRSVSPSLKHVIVVGDPGTGTGFTPFTDLLTSAPEAGPAITSRASGGDAALLLLSGGTTGLPKLIPRTHDDYLYNSRAAGEVCELTEESVYLAALPVAFNYTMNCPGVLGALSVGGRVVLAGNPDPGYCFDLIEREGVTIAAINPQLAPVWLDEAAVTDADLSTLRVLQVGSARLADETARKMVAELGCVIQQVFGMAEGLLCLTRLSDPPEIITTTQGRPISPADEIKVAGPDDQEVPDGEEGSCSSADRTRCAATTTPTNTTPRVSPTTASTVPATAYAAARRDTSSWWAGRRTRSTAAVRRSRPPRSRGICWPIPRFSPPRCCPRPTPTWASAPSPSSSSTAVPTLFPHRTARNSLPSSTSGAWPPSRPPMRCGSST
ncbi:hypothetical protein SVIO_003140 [Streptomyces violaceusniger]|uniref:AMP-dependent synthetase/ligase domain-containing protein n=1 Tax=Streptomyces violaceusniger TaxID=68280 RepID=A0A4D4KKL7_STRVO|nr:hypothetical protein SVIO_003140 [Streptomyces violaceusniger]